MDQNSQEKEFYKDGWIRKPSDNIEYGLVKKEVNNANVPVYQLSQDEEWRLNLHPIGNTMAYTGPNAHEYEGWFPDRNRLPGTAMYPTSLYISDNGQFYQKGWDYNNYSGTDGVPILGSFLDMIGSPVVTTTGYTRFNDNAFWNDIYPYISKTRDYRSANPGQTTVVPEFEQLMYDYYNMLPEISASRNTKTGHTNTSYNQKVKLRALGGSLNSIDFLHSIGNIT